MVDFEEAVAAGMAVKVPWDPSIRPPARQRAARDRGARRRPGRRRRAGELLEAHRFTEGLELVPQGTPTNNTGTGRAGFTEVPDDLEAFLARQLAE